MYIDSLLNFKFFTVEVFSKDYNINFKAASQKEESIGYSTTYLL